MPVPQTFINQMHYDLNGIVVSRAITHCAGRNIWPSRSICTQPALRFHTTYIFISLNYPGTQATEIFWGK